MFSHFIPRNNKVGTLNIRGYPHNSRDSLEFIQGFRCGSRFRCRGILCRCLRRLEPWKIWVVTHGFSVQMIVGGFDAFRQFRHKGSAFHSRRDWR